MAQVAERLGLSKASVYKLCNSGDLPHVRVGPNSVRVTEADLAVFVAARRKAGR